MTDANNTAPAPDADSAYSADFILNQSTKEFFTTFFNAFNTADLPELRQHYFFGFNELQDKYFKDTPWPDETGHYCFDTRSRNVFRSVQHSPNIAAMCSNKCKYGLHLYADPVDTFARIEQLLV